MGLDDVKALAAELIARDDEAKQQIRVARRAWEDLRDQILQQTAMDAAKKVRPLILQEFGEIGDVLDPDNGIESFRSFADAVQEAGGAPVQPRDHKLILDVSMAGYEVRAASFACTSEVSWLIAIRTLQENTLADMQDVPHRRTRTGPLIYRACRRVLVAYDPTFDPRVA